MAKRTAAKSTPTTQNSPVRKYLTATEIERLIKAARTSSRYGLRDATMILIAYRHGLRASELCDLQWSEVELAPGRLHVRRVKQGTPSVHPMQGDEIRSLRALQREQEASQFVFVTERGGPMAPKAFNHLLHRIGSDRMNVLLTRIHSGPARVAAPHIQDKILAQDMRPPTAIVPAL